MNNTMQELINKLNKANYAYYNTDTPIMSDIEYDTLLDTLKEMEKESGVIMSNSPTQRVGAPILDELKKVSIKDKPMLSLDKCHSAEEVFIFAKGKKLIGSIKCDGLSTRLIYEKGKLVSANTRGDGYEGSDITEHVKQFLNVPLTINTNKRYVVDGESIIKDNDFETLEGFKNSRNAASGALSLLDVSEVKNRKLSFVVWDIVEGEEDEDSLTEKLYHAQKLGFEVVKGVELPSIELSIEKIEEGNKIVLAKAKEYGYPCDGVVWKFDSVSFGNMQGATSHHFNNGIAWKPSVESAETELIDIEWSMGRTGQITPVAIFKPVELEGSTVERASLHNISVLQNILHGNGYKGQKVLVVKSNLIIPQITDSRFDEGDYILHGFNVPSKCPICGGNTEIRKDNDSEVLYCSNPDCEGKILNRFEHFCGKKGLNIKGFSKATIEKLMYWGWLNTYQDIFLLKQVRDKWIKKPGFGVASVDRILNAIEESKDTTLAQIIAAAGIPEIGSRVAKDLAKHYNSWDDFRAETNFLQYDGIGEVMNYNLLNFDYEDLNLDYTVNLHLKPHIHNNNNNNIEEKYLLEGKIFCITGTLTTYKNRNELIADIENKGGKVTSSISSKTNYLINNDMNSTSSKNIKAKQLGIPIISELEYKSLI